MELLQEVQLPQERIGHSQPSGNIGFRLDARTGPADRDIDHSDGTIGRRVVAFMIDAILLSMAVPIAWFLGVTSFGLLTPILTLALAILPLAYHSLMISSGRGSTLGQAAMGLRVIDRSGKRPQLVQAAILTMLFYATLVFTSGLLLIWCLFDDKQRCLHDILAGTMTVRSDRV